MIKNKIKIKTIKTNILIFPIVLLTVGIVVLGISNTKVTHKYLLEEVEKRGNEVLSQTIKTLEESKKAVELTDKIMDDKILLIAKEISNIPIGTNEQLVEISNSHNADEINIFDDKGIIRLSSINEIINWQAPKEHRVYTILAGDEQFSTEPMRKDMHSDSIKKYGYFKLPNGQVVQVGINADEAYKIEESFSYQNIVERLASEEDIVYALYIDKNLKAVAHSNKERVGIDLTDEGSKIAAIEGKL